MATGMKQCRQTTAEPMLSNTLTESSLIEVEADHDLNGHLDLIWDSVQSFLLDA